MTRNYKLIKLERKLLTEGLLKYLRFQTPSLFAPLLLPNTLPKLTSPAIVTCVESAHILWSLVYYCSPSRSPAAPLRQCIRMFEQPHH